MSTTIKPVTATIDGVLVDEQSAKVIPTERPAILEDEPETGTCHVCGDRNAKYKDENLRWVCWHHWQPERESQADNMETF